MKRYLLMLCLVFFVVVSFSQKKKEIDVYLIGGQSNASGQGYMKNIPSDFEVDKSVHFFYSQKSGGGATALEWGPLCQASETPDKFGVELSMGTMLKQLNPDREIALIKHALSGSNLYNQWTPGKNKNDTENFGPEFKKFIHTVEQGLKELEAKGFKPKIKAMVWQQGEADARDIAGMENSRNYGKNLHRFIKRIREQLGVPKMLFVYGYVIPVPLDRFTGREEVRAAQKNLDQNSGHKLALKRAFVVETDDLPLRCDEPNSPYPDDKVHFNTSGILELGERFANKINQELK
ncbi:MAG: sialate O-acetylesterase [Bacteroidota bacterium]